jgi:ubiquinone biosynthesis accessory factor UbiJ
MAQFSVPALILKSINHVIEQEKWAHDLLLSREGQIVAISLPVGNFQLMIQNGLLANTSDNTGVAAVSLEISQEAIWAFLREGKSGAMKFVRISGDVDFAADLNRLAADLKWEAEEDLAKLIGDAPSRRILLESKKLFQQASLAVDDFKLGLRDYLVNEKNTLLGAQQFNEFKSEIRLLRDQLDRTEKKIIKLDESINGKEAR